MQLLVAEPQQYSSVTLHPNPNLAALESGADGVVIITMPLFDEVFVFGGGSNIKTVPLWESSFLFGEGLGIKT